MGNASVIPITPSYDISPDIYLAVFHSTRGDNSDSGTEEFATQVRIAEKTIIQAGPEPSVAHISIPMKADLVTDESAFSVAFKKDGPLGKLQPNQRATVGVLAGGSSPVAMITGTIMEVNHDAGSDGGLVTIVDDRYILEKYTVFGQLQYDPISAQMMFISAEECVFNWLGWPNCLDTPKGPRFSPTIRYGWKETDTEEPDPGAAKTRSRSWRGSDAIQLLRDCHYDSRDWPGEGPLSYGQRFLPDEFINWPKHLGGSLTRPLHNVKVDGLDLRTALSHICKSCGPYEINFSPALMSGIGGGGGDNGNDVEAGPIGGIALYQAFKSTVTSQVSAMNSAFNSGLAQFTQALSNATQVMTTAFNSFQNNLNGALMSFTAMSSHVFNNLQTVLSGSSGANYQQNALAPYGQLLAELGHQLEGNVGLFPLPTGAINTVTPNGTRFSSSTLARAVRGMESARSNLGIVSFGNPKNGKRFYVPGLTGDDLLNAMGGNGVVGGYLKESIANYYHEVAILGDAPCVERRFSMDDSTLEQAWSSADETAWKSYINLNGKNRTAFEQACMLYPLVYAAYRIPSNYNYLAGTKWEDAGNLPRRRHPKILPSLLSGVNFDTTTPVNWIPRPIPIEYNDTTWKLCSQYDNLDVSMDGTYFLITALRDSGTHETWSGSLATPLSIVARNIRATLAVSADFRIMGKAGKFSDPNESYARVYNDQGSHQITTYTIVAPPLDYVEWLRNGSHPIGADAETNGNKSFPDACSNGNELFSDCKGEDGVSGTSGGTGRIAAHAVFRQGDVKRIEGNGQLNFKQFEAAFQPGLPISGVDQSGIKISGTIKSVSFEHNTQDILVSVG